MIFADRREAGAKLAKALKKFKKEKTIILAIPRGGIAVAYHSIKTNNFQWDLIIPRKIGAPHHKEIAIGAVSSDGTYFVDDKYVKLLGIPKEYIEKEVEKEVGEIKERLRKYKESEDFPKVENKTVIIIDDGIATGFTILAAIESLKKHNAEKIIVAVPVAARESIDMLKEVVNEVICLYIPTHFHAVGMYYENFNQVTDKEVFELINDLKK